MNSTQKNPTGADKNLKLQAELRRLRAVARLAKALAAEARQRYYGPALSRWEKETGYDDSLKKEPRYIVAHKGDRQDGPDCGATSPDVYRKLPAYKVKGYQWRWCKRCKR